MTAGSTDHGYGNRNPGIFVPPQSTSLMFSLSLNGRICDCYANEELPLGEDAQVVVSNIKLSGKSKRYNLLLKTI